MNLSTEWFHWRPDLGVWRVVNQPTGWQPEEHDMWQWTTNAVATMQPPVRYEMKDTGNRHQYTSGNVREPSQGKPRFDLLIPAGVPYKEQMLTRFAELMAKGAEKYSDRNWENANSEEEEARFQEAAIRHFMQWFTGERDEDHAAALMFNVMAYEATRYKRRLNG